MEILLRLLWQSTFATRFATQNDRKLFVEISLRFRCEIVAISLRFRGDFVGCFHIVLATSTDSSVFFLLR